MKKKKIYKKIMSVLSTLLAMVMAAKYSGEIFVMDLPCSIIIENI